MSTPRRHGLAEHIAATTHGIGRPRAHRTRRRLGMWARLALALAAAAVIAWARSRA